MLLADNLLAGLTRTHGIDLNQFIMSRMAGTCSNGIMEFTGSRSKNAGVLALPIEVGRASEGPGVADMTCA